MGDKMEFKIKIQLDNAAFYDQDGNHEPEFEIARLIKEDILPKVESGLLDGNLLDVNGNKVGKFYAI